jgi:hypothetical protein
LEAAAGVIEERHGLASLAGGRHPGWGTANRIVPLGDTYLELVAVINDTEAGRSMFGRWIMAADPEFLRPLGWVVRTDQLDNIARRLDLTPEHGSRVTTSGQSLSWRSAGVEQAAREPGLPFLIEWAPETRFPGDASVRHPNGLVKLARLELRGDTAHLAAWVGEHELPITCVPGATRAHEDRPHRTRARNHSRISRGRRERLTPREIWQDDRQGVVSRPNRPVLRLLPA